MVNPLGVGLSNNFDNRGAFMLACISCQINEEVADFSACFVNPLESRFSVGKRLSVMRASVLICGCAFIALVAVLCGQCNRQRDTGDFGCLLGAQK
jgi:hypothetical protein